MAVAVDLSELQKNAPLAGIGITCALQCYDPAWVEVYYGVSRVKAVYLTDYTVVLDLDYLGFTLTPTASLVTKITALGEANTIFVVRNPPVITDFVATDAFIRDKIAYAVDKLYMVVQSANKRQAAASAKWYVDVTVPSNALGVVGDMYLKSTNGEVYGPKSALGWGAVSANIRGPQNSGADAVTSVAGRTGAVVIAQADIANLVSDIAAKAGLGANTYTADQTAQSTDAGATEQPSFVADRNSPSPAASDILGSFVLRGRSSTAVSRVYARIRALIKTATNGAEDGLLALRTIVAGVEADRLIIGAGVYSPNATGGDKGVDTLNYKFIYVDGVLISSTPTYSPAALAADTNNYDPAVTGTSGIVRMSASATVQVTGLVGGAAGAGRVLTNVGTIDILLKNENTSSTAANRFSFSFGSFILGAGKSIELLYDATSSRWRPTTTPDARNYVYLAADVTNVGADALTDLTGLSFPVVAGQTYKFKVVAGFTSTFTSSGSRWTINGPALTNIKYVSRYSLTATTETTNNCTGYNQPAAMNAGNASTTMNSAVVEGTLTPSANGTLIGRVAGASAGITAKAGVTFIEYEAIGN